MKRLSAAILALALSLAAAGAAAQTTYMRGNSADPATLDPQLVVSAAEANIVRDLYEGLVVYDAAGNLVPGAAARWTVSPDGLRYTFSLRSDGRWSDGSAVEAGAFVAAFRRLVDPATAAPDAALFAGLAGAAAILSGDAAAETLGVRALGRLRLEVTLDRPMPQLLALLARPAAMPLHGAAPAANPPGPDTPTNGAYVIEAIAPGEAVQLARNPAFHDAAAVAIDTVIYRPTPLEQADDAFAAGELLSSNGIVLAEQDELGDGLRVAPYLGVYFYVAGLDGVLADPAIRRALAMAADRDAVNAEVWAGAMLPAESLIPGGINGLGAPAVADLGPADRDGRLAMAAALLEDAGYGPDRPLTLTLAIAEGTLNRATAEALAADWAVLGIETTIVAAPAETHYARLTTTREFDLASVAWIGDYDHVETFLGLFSGEGNIGGYANPEYEEQIEAARAEPDRSVREALYAAAARTLMRDLPAIPLLQYASLNLISGRLSGWQDNLVDVHLSRWMSVSQ